MPSSYRERTDPPQPLTHNWRKPSCFISSHCSITSACSLHERIYLCVIIAETESPIDRTWTPAMRLAALNPVQVTGSIDATVDVK